VVGQTKLLLGGPAVGDVGARAGHLGGAAVRSEHDASLVGDPADPAVRQHDAELVVEAAALLQRVADRALDELPVVGMDAGDEVL
jgi:hypothetical protein